MTAKEARQIVELVMTMAPEIQNGRDLELHGAVQLKDSPPWWVETSNLWMWSFGPWLVVPRWLDSPSHKIISVNGSGKLVALFQLDGLEVQKLWEGSLDEEA